MISKLKAALDDDRGVSPVIGVILMVAITVILAAVIGTFVLGLGDSLQQAPQAQLDATSGAADTVNISHSGGDPLPYSEITVQIDSEDVANSTLSGTSGSELSVGNSIHIDLPSVSGLGYTAGDGGTFTVKIVHDPSQSILLDTEVEVQA